jgi:hypothetical protein
MTPSGFDDDPLLASLAALRTWDVPPRRVTNLRARCHAALRSAAITNDPGVPRWVRMLAPAATGAWCATYLFETLRRAAVVYGF